MSLLSVGSLLDCQAPPALSSLSLLLTARGIRMGSLQLAGNPSGSGPSVLSHGKVDITFSCIAFRRRSGLHSSQQRNVQVRRRPHFVGLESIAAELPGQGDGRGMSLLRSRIWEGVEAAITLARRQLHQRSSCTCVRQEIGAVPVSVLWHGWISA